jgi:hypothetical protein
MASKPTLIAVIDAASTRSEDYFHEPSNQDIERIVYKKWLRVFKKTGKQLL